jgi:signal transduction histidine kinase
VKDSGTVHPIRTVGPRPVDQDALVGRLRLTAVSLGYALLMPPALALGILTILSIPLGLVTAGIVIALAVVPATAALVRVHRRVSGALLGLRIPATYADTAGANALTRPLRWLTDSARWRDVGLLWFSATGGFVLSLLPPALLLAPVTHLVLAAVDGGFWWLLLLVDGPLLVVWWCVTPALVRARALAEANILGHSRAAALERRVEQVSASRAETVDHSAAEIRRIERDLHDGAQARMAAVGMSVGLAETLLRTDPVAAAELLREARETTVSALEDLRSVVRGIHPPALADLGLPGAVEALAVSLPLPVTVALDVPADVAAPVESAAYFAIAECLANTVKHADAARAWVTGRHAGGRLRIVVGDDGRGGAQADGSGLSGVARRLAAFDGTIAVDSPGGGPTVVTLEVPCPTGR